jgi:hypothetical protein
MYQLERRSQACDQLSKERCCAVSSGETHAMLCLGAGEGGPLEVGRGPKLGGDV